MSFRIGVFDFRRRWIFRLVAFVFFWGLFFFPLLHAPFFLIALFRESKLAGYSPTRLRLGRFSYLLGLTSLIGIILVSVDMSGLSWAPLPQLVGWVGTLTLVTLRLRSYPLLIKSAIACTLAFALSVVVGYSIRATLGPATVLEPLGYLSLAGSCGLMIIAILGVFLPPRATDYALEDAW